jgi:hypothetical protein
MVTDSDFDSVRMDHGNFASAALLVTRRARSRASAASLVTRRASVLCSATRAVAARICVRLAAPRPMQIEPRRSRFVAVAGHAADSRARAAHDRGMKPKFRAPNRDGAG